MKMKKLRAAIAMIELIFAIVVMGIVMLSAPMLISTASKSGYTAIQQESINEAASQINLILGYPWDESNTNESYDPIVLTTTNGDGNLSENGASGLRAGTPRESYRKYYSSTGVTGGATAIGTLGEAAGLNDIDDFEGTQVNLRLEQAGGTANYIETATINIDRTVAYMTDSPAGGDAYNDGGGGTLTFTPNFAANAAATTNIKRIQVTLTSTAGVDELEKEINLHAFSCNIGSFALEERN